MVAEAWVTDLERLAQYLRPDEYHQAFDFDFLQAPWGAEEMQRAIDESMDAVGGVGSIPTWVLSNHDVPRHATRYGLPNDVETRVGDGGGPGSPRRGARSAEGASSSTPLARPSRIRIRLSG